MDALLDQEYTKRQFEVMVADLWPKASADPAPFSKEQYSLIGLLESSPTIDDGFRYTKWGALNAVSEFQCWGSRFNAGGPSVEEKRTMHSVFGRGKAQTDRAYAYLSS
jgi:hypothetical protein